MATAFLTADYADSTDGMGLSFLTADYADAADGMGLSFFVSDLKADLDCGAGFVGAVSPMGFAVIGRWFNKAARDKVTRCVQTKLSSQKKPPSLPLPIRDIRVIRGQKKSHPRILFFLFQWGFGLRRGLCWGRFAHGLCSHRPLVQQSSSRQGYPLGRGQRRVKWLAQNDSSPAAAALRVSVFGAFG